VITSEAYRAFLESGPPPPVECDGTENPAACWGEQLYTSNGCVACHSKDGSPAPGPTWQGLWGRQGSFVDGGTYVADENYIREAILQPQAHIVTG
jgi:cytochrome c oxidase subunit 2